MSNVFLGYHSNFKEGTARKLYNLGIPITINPDDPGTFGYVDTTFDYFIATIAYDWNLLNLKKLAENSIDYSICSIK